MTLWTNSLSAFVSKSDRADQPFNRGGAERPWGSGATVKKSSKPCAQGRKKGRRRRGTRTKRVHRCSGPPFGAPALAQAATVGPLHSPGLGERKAEKKNDRENVRKCTQAAGPMQALQSPMHTNARTCTPNAPGMQAQVVIMMQLIVSKYVLCF